MIALSYIRTKLPDYLVEDDTVEAILSKRELSSSDDIDLSDNDAFKPLEISYADCLLYVVRLPKSISQGSFSMSNVDLEQYKHEVIAIYTKYDMDAEIKVLVKKPDIINAGEWY